MIVPTPSGPDGRFSLTQVLDAVTPIGAALREKAGFHVVSLTSTVMPGDTAAGVLPALEKASGKKCGTDFGLCYNPEFIALGNVINGILYPGFLLIGESDVDVVTSALRLDTRIGGKYLRGAVGFGGPCFPRDNVAFCTLAREIGSPATLAEATDSLNRSSGPFRADGDVSLTRRGGRRDPGAVLQTGHARGRGVAEPRAGAATGRGRDARSRVRSGGHGCRPGGPGGEGHVRRFRE